MKFTLGNSVNIYIYGTKDFKKDIIGLIDHSTILKLKMRNDEGIRELNSLDELKEMILSNPDNIFLIDDTKIYSNDFINKKLKFLKPKDAIEKSFLLENGIGDVNVDVDSLDGLKKYLISRYEDVSDTKKIFETQNEIQNSIEAIVDKAYSENKENEIQGDAMMNIDDLSENDVLSALSIDTSNNSKAEKNGNSVSIDVNNIDDLSKLLNYLSGHKTLEITVKVK